MEQPDNWFWLVVKTPDDGVHLYELGYPQLVDNARVALSEQRFAEIREELGAPVTNVWEHPEWSFDMAPGRPNGYLEPKTYTEGPKGEQVLTPIKAKPGVTLHLLEH